MKLGFSSRQWFLLIVFGIVQILTGSLYTIQAPFYPAEVIIFISNSNEGSLIIIVSIVACHFSHLGCKEECYRNRIRCRVRFIRIYSPSGMSRDGFHCK
jgi:hypothetical protein